MLNPCSFLYLPPIPASCMQWPEFDARSTRISCALLPPGVKPSHVEVASLALYLAFWLAFSSHTTLGLRCSLTNFKCTWLFAPFNAPARMQFRRIKVNLTAFAGGSINCRSCFSHGQNTCSADPCQCKPSPSPAQSNPNPIQLPAPSGIDYSNPISDLNSLSQQFALQNRIKWAQFVQNLHGWNKKMPRIIILNREYFSWKLVVRSVHNCAGIINWHKVSLENQRKWESLLLTSFCGRSKLWKVNSWKTSVCPIGLKVII